MSIVSVACGIGIEGALTSSTLGTFTFPVRTRTAKITVAIIINVPIKT